MTIGNRIRPAQPEECEVLGALAFRAKASWGYGNEFMAACRAELAVSAEALVDPNVRHGVAERDGVVVGFFVVRRLTAHEWDLDALFVEPAFLRRGVGRWLMQHAIAAAREAGARALLVQSDPNAASFYAAVGGLRDGTRASESIAGRMLPVFRFALGPGA